MRAWLLGVIALCACSPDIVADAYLCGPNQTCPPDQVCSGSNNSCENPATATAFACTPAEEANEPDDTAAMAFTLPSLGCVSQLVSVDGCLAAGDPSDWYQFTTPSNCTAVAVDLQVSFPIANEAVDVMLADSTGAMLAVDTPCKTSATNGEDDRCLTMTLANGTDYTIEVLTNGSGDCGGACNYNRYTLGVQLQTPD